MDKKIDFAIGGQAVIEGVMMRAPEVVTVAVRKEKGHIVTKEDQYISITKRLKVLGIPLVRGVVNLFEMMIIGFKALNYSASEMMYEDDKDKENLTKLQKFIESASMVFSFVFAIALSLFLFKFLPLWITEYLSNTFHWLKNSFIFNTIDGILKTSFFFIYLLLVSLLPDFKEVLKYHGAEHKSIHTYEKNLELTPENAEKQTRFHPRCGTSFIIIVFVISILTYTVIPRNPDFYLNFLQRVAFLPLIAGISYEFLKWSAKRENNPLMKLVIKPGLWFQKLTTKEPTKAQLEVALTALKKALEFKRT
jgi:uncharacterized protein YqhQ